MTRRIRPLLVVTVALAAGGSRRERHRWRNRALARIRRPASCPSWCWASGGAREPALRAGADEFVARPAFIRDVLTLSQLAVAIRQDGDESGVAGCSRITSCIS